MFRPDEGRGGYRSQRPSTTVNRPSKDLAGCCFEQLLNDTQCTIGRWLNAEIVEFFSGPELCGQPAWLLSAAGPSLRGLSRILVLGNYLRVGTPGVACMLRDVIRSPTKLS